MTRGRSIAITAPAKINLGLEILGKRTDGYHEIRTVMAMIDLADTLAISINEADAAVRISGVPGVAPKDNLIGRAIQAFADESGIRAGYDIEVEKRIPSPGGLGGASSDAASTLLALNALHADPIPESALTRLAGKLGADVPFFLGPTVALGSGIGTTLKPLPAAEGWVVLVVPSLDIAGKTQRLYGTLLQQDFTDGGRADVVADAISSGHLPTPDMLHNAFERPLYEIAPQLERVRGRMLSAGAPFVALSGAGPAHYALFDRESDARTFLSDFRAASGGETLVTVARFLRARPSVEVREG